MTMRMTMRMTMKKLTPKYLLLPLTLVRKQFLWPTHLSIFACHNCVSTVVRQLEIVKKFIEQINNLPLHALKTFLHFTAKRLHSDKGLHTIIFIWKIQFIHNNQLVINLSKTPVSFDLVQHDNQTKNIHYSSWILLL